MKTFKIGSDASFLVSFIDDDGDPVTPTAVTYSVADEDGDELIASTALADISGSDGEIVIPAATHTAAGAYVLTVVVTEGAANYEQEIIYGIRNAQNLELLKNTFQTLPRALFLAQTVHNVQMFIGGAKEDQEIALIEAFNRLIRLNYVIPWAEMVDTQSYLKPGYTSHLTPLMWPLMTVDAWNNYPKEFRDALCRAQVIESSSILTIDPYLDRRRAGLMSESVGESSMMFKGGVRPLDPGVSRQTLDCMSSYINNRVTLTRT